LASDAASSSAGRVVVIGLDVGDGALIRHWASVGAMPSFRALLDQGSWYELESPAQVLHTSTWPTFATGTSPGRHGVYYPFQPRPGHQQAQHVAADQYGAPSFWHLADRHGRRCLIYDVPETFPEPGFKGRAIFEWGTWAWYGTRAAQPPQLLTDLKARFGDYPLGMEAMRLGLGRPSRTLLQQKLPESVVHKRESLQWLMQQGEWDLVVATFCETHPAAHYLWPEGARDAVGTEVNRFRPMHGVYAAVDRAIGALHESLPPDTTLMIVSGDGVQPNNAGWHLLPGVLEKLGYLNGRQQAGGKGRIKPQRSLLGTLKGLVSPRMRRLIADTLPWKLRNLLGAHLEAQVDWAHTRAFTLPTDLEGCIRVNLKGREPQGIVAPGAEYKALCESLRTQLADLINPATGKSAVRKVWVRDEVFPGQRRDQLPDIVVSWNNDAPIAALAIPSVGIVEGPSPDPRTGTHSSSGFLLACGPGIPAGRSSHAALVQVAPTVLRRLGFTEDFKLDGAALDFSNH
jgi:predicted AlkP superfamily phosphohydrolase/phosphomutase